jgi:hypothetical protein
MNAAIALAALVGLAGEMPILDFGNDGTPHGVCEPVISQNGIRRNDKCTCGSGKKYKKCCMPRVRIWQGPIKPMHEAKEIGER